jgi:septum formation protein
MIILASQSPRRKELLAELVPTFTVVPADIDESVRIGETPLAYVARMAAEKAAVVLPNHPNDLVIASDTTVTINGEILGKPVDRQDAYRMLRLMSGKKHWVHTAVYLQKGDQQCQTVVSAEVTFSPLTDEMIHRYLDLGEYADKAGAYGIQGAAKVFVEAINGDYYAIVGFPVNTVSHLLAEFPEEATK